MEWTKYEVDMFGGWNANGVLLAFEFGTADTGLYQLDDIQVLGRFQSQNVWLCRLLKAYIHRSGCPVRHSLHLSYKVAC